MTDGPASFWDHLDALRSTLIRAVVATMVCAVVAFVFKDELFAIILAPRSEGFVSYRLLDRVAALSGNSLDGGFNVSLINTGLARQFMLHVQTALYAGLLCASPYIIYVLFRFVSPALYDRERRMAIRAIVPAYAMFILGVLTAYYLIFPLTFRFLASYQVSVDVANLITLDSYMDTMLMLCLMMGVMFELPVVCALLGRLGMLTPGAMRRKRRHAFVVILIAAAFITPTADAFTLFAVAMPVYLLYEVSVLAVARTTRRKQRA